jgi:hypothetical protein
MHGLHRDLGSRVAGRRCKGLQADHQTVADAHVGGKLAPLPKVTVVVPTFMEPAVE